MKNATLIPVFAALTILSSATTPVLAQVESTSQSEVKTSYQLSPVTQTALVVSVPSAIQFELQGDKSYPTTLLLLQPVLDPSGNVIVPANSPVQARVAPTNGGVQIVAEALINEGRSIAIQATSSPIPTQSIKRTVAAERAGRDASIGSRLVGSLFGFLGGSNNSNSQDPSSALQGPDAAQMSKGALIGNAAGIMVGLFSSDRADIATIPQGSVYVLNLQSPISMPTVSIPPVTRQQPKASKEANTSMAEEKVNIEAPKHLACSSQVMGSSTQQRTLSCSR
jgi:hypothetical protein